MKNAKWKTILVLLIMFVVFYIIMKDDYQNIINTIQSANHLLIVLSIIFIIGYYLLKAECLYLITKEQKKEITYGKMLHQTLITQFFNGITPFSTGGQPMQVYMLNKSGLPISKATSIIIQDFLMYQLALVTIGIFALVSNQIFSFININIAVYSLIMLGFIINTAIGLCLVFISFSRKFNNFVGKLLIKILSKLRIVKDKEKTIKEWETKLDEFHESGKIFKKNKALFVKCYSFNVLALLAFYLIPFLVLVSFDPNCGITVFSALTCSAFVLLVGNFVPIPGGSGGIEYSFYLIFGGIVKETLLSPAVLVWRFITYYLGVLIGGVALGFFKTKGSEN
jgi:hypothetical protein